MRGNFSRSYTYDANGNTLTDAQGRSFTWDFENRLTQVVNPGVGTTTFRYDPFGRRIQKSGPLGTTNYLYDGIDPNGNAIEEVDQSGNILARYAQSLAIDQPLAESRSGTISYYQQDGISSVTSLSNSAAALAITYTFDSFGKLTASTGTLTNPFQFTGRNLDTETGISYYRARYYDESVGRFITEDPIGFIGGQNFYRYVYNSPIGLNDPWGLSAASVGQVEARCLQCIKNITDRGERLSWNSNNTFGKEIIGWINDLSSWVTKHKACWDQAYSAENCLNGYPFPDGWRFNDIPVRGGFHHVVRGHDNDPNDPDVICDPWRNETYTVPRPPSGGGSAF
ncbi:MAG: RHS repeat-associated core domain-containing protein [Candidatus Sulfotelmatobacter sp.]